MSSLRQPTILAMSGPGTREITPDAIAAQAWKFYFAALAWPLYNFALPWVHQQIGWWSLLCMFFPGVFLGNWLALLLHECWHRYLPKLPNERLFTLFSWLLLTDPQIFRALHPDHHRKVSTWDDREVHPFGYIRSRPLRVLSHVLELTLGMLYIVLAWNVVVPTHPSYRKRYRLRSLLQSIVAWGTLIGGLVAAERALFGISAAGVLVPLGVSFWISALMLHYSTLIQHGNLIVEGDLDERNRWVRSLRAEGPLSVLFLILTHQDQVLHHTLPSCYTRPFRNNLRAVPEGAVLIGFKDLGRIVADMLAGRPTDHTRLGERSSGSLKVERGTPTHRL